MNNNKTRKTKNKIDVIKMEELINKKRRKINK